MPIDTSIYQGLNKIQPPEMPSYGDSAVKALTLSHLAMQSRQAQQTEQDQGAVRTAFSKNVGPDGQVNRAGVLSDLAKTAPLQAMQYKGQFAEMDQKQADAQQKVMADKINQMGLAAQMAMSAKDQPSYDAMIGQMKGMGLDTSHMPAQYDPGLMRQYAVASLDQKSRLEAMTKTSEMDISQAKAPLERDKLIAETDKLRSEVGKEKKGRPLAAEQSDKLAGHDASFKQLDDLEAAISANKDIVGPYAGRFKAMNPYNTRAQDLQALVGAAAQKVGKSLEGGKLTDADIDRYKKMLPTNSDTPEVALQKIAQVRRMVAQQQGSDLDTYGRAGLDVSKFSPVAVNSVDITQPKRTGAGISGVATANAADRPNFDAMSVEDLKAYVGGK